MTLNSYAKLNLYLEVLGRRKDKYHSLKTLFTRIGLADKIILNPRADKSIKILCAHPLVPKNRFNICYRSAQLLRDTFGLSCGVEIKIAKRIPVSAGLGGGSGNAAAVLLGLNKLWRLNLTLKELVGLGEKIGADVPFFLYDTAFALGTCRGDKIKPIAALKGLRFWYVLAVPKIEVLTARIYREWDRYSGLTRPVNDVNILTLALKKKDLSLAPKLLFNSLEEVTQRLYPQVRLVKEAFYRLGLETTLMSGSGPAVFGIVSSRKEAVSISSRMKKQKQGWRVYIARTC